MVYLLTYMRVFGFQFVISDLRSDCLDWDPESRTWNVNDRIFWNSQLIDYYGTKSDFVASFLVNASPIKRTKVVSF